MPGSTTRTKTRSRDSVGYNALQLVPFDTIASVAANTALTTIQSAVVLPCTCKIFAASVYFSAINTSTGTHRFNIAAGTGTYETSAGALATTYGTVAGTVHTGDVVTITITVPSALAAAAGSQPTYAGTLGIPPATGGAEQFVIPYTILSTDTTATIAATSIAAAINSTGTLNQIIFANTSAGQVNFTALTPGTSANSITITSAVTGTGATTTFAINASPMSGGTANTGLVLGTNDTFEYLGTNTYASATSAALGATALFGDQALFANIPVGMQPYWSSNWDTVYRKGTIMTLRVLTPASTGSITNLKVCMLLMPFDTATAQPEFVAFAPQRAIS